MPFTRHFPMESPQGKQAEVIIRANKFMNKIKNIKLRATVVVMESFQYRSSVAIH